MPDPFDKNDRGAILAALDDPNPENPIAKAMAARIATFMDNLETQARRLGQIPPELLLVKPSTVYDDIVIRLCLQEVAERFGQKIAIHWL
jgi:hypothetical protein